MEVRVDELGILYTGRAGAAGIAACRKCRVNDPVPAIDKLGIRNGHGQLPASFRAKEELGVANPVFTYSLNEPALNFCLAGYIFELQVLMFFFLPTDKAVGYFFPSSDG
jgi:hypothetical protein